MPKVIGIGKQRYDRIIENDGFYIDKTMFIKEWWENQDDVTLITRPSNILCRDSEMQETEFSEPSNKMCDRPY